MSRTVQQQPSVYLSSLVLFASQHQRPRTYAHASGSHHRLPVSQSVSLASPIGNNRLVAADFEFPMSFFSVRLLPFACMTVRRRSCKNVPCDSVLFRSFHSVAVVVGFFIGFEFGVGFCQLPWWPEGTCVCVLRRSGFYRFGLVAAAS
ncbi:unnamed protein product [Sphagnum jensenii]|uniref:Uncharacterized protein n=1 Tax=Sphagnum jensenii TaxID=128206 RepID=A0ABP0X7V8_9BRYO